MCVCERERESGREGGGEGGRERETEGWGEEGVKSIRWVHFKYNVRAKSP